MRSSHARGKLSFLSQSRAKGIKELIDRTARAKGVRVYRYANSGNHLHLIILPRSRQAYFSFIRAISGLIARLTLGAHSGMGARLHSHEQLSGTKYSGGAGVCSVCAEDKNRFQPATRNGRTTRGAE